MPSLCCSSSAQALLLPFVSSLHSHYVLSILSLLQVASGFDRLSCVISDESLCTTPIAGQDTIHQHGASDMTASFVSSIYGILAFLHCTAGLLKLRSRVSCEIRN